MRLNFHDILAAPAYSTHTASLRFHLELSPPELGANDHAWPTVHIPPKSGPQTSQLGAALPSGLNQTWQRHSHPKQIQPHYRPFDLSVEGLSLPCHPNRLSAYTYSRSYKTEIPAEYGYLRIHGGRNPISDSRRPCRPRKRITRTQQLAISGRDLRLWQPPHHNPKYYATAPKPRRTAPRTRRKYQQSQGPKSSHQTHHWTFRIKTTMLASLLDSHYHPYTLKPSSKPSSNGSPPPRTPTRSARPRISPSRLSPSAKSSAYGKAYCPTPSSRLKPKQTRAPEATSPSTRQPKNRRRRASTPWSRSGTLTCGPWRHGDRRTSHRPAP